MRIDVLLLALLLPALPLGAQTASSADETAIRAIEAQWEAAWNHHDAAALARLATPDADFVNARGAWAKGRNELEKNQAERHRTTEKESVWRTTEVDIRFVTPEIAIVHVYWTLAGERAADGTLRPPHMGIITRTEVKREGQWLIAASQATNVVSQ